MAQSLVATHRSFSVARVRTPYNEFITAPKVRVLKQSGESLGILDIAEARAMAKKEGLDLVLTVNTTSPPICRIMKYTDWQQDAQKRQVAQAEKAPKKPKEVQLSLRIDRADWNRKISDIVRFLNERHPVHVLVKTATLLPDHDAKRREMFHRVVAAVGKAGVFSVPPAKQALAAAAVHATLNNLPQPEGHDAEGAPFSEPYIVFNPVSSSKSSSSTAPSSAAGNKPTASPAGTSANDQPVITTIKS